MLVAAFPVVMRTRFACADVLKCVETRVAAVEAVVLSRVTKELAWVRPWNRVVLMGVDGTF